MALHWPVYSAGDIGNVFKVFSPVTCRARYVCERDDGKVEGHTALERSVLETDRQKGLGKELLKKERNSCFSSAIILTLSMDIMRRQSYESTEQSFFFS